MRELALVKIVSQHHVLNPRPSDSSLPSRRINPFLIEIFFSSEIKSSQYSIPDDGRVSEDTKSLIRKLLLVDASRRMSASQVRESLESTITIWKSISPSASNFQVLLLTLSYQILEQIIKCSQ